jgi:hypothetical protein
MILIGVPTGEGNFAHGLVVLMQELPGLGDTQRVDIFFKVIDPVLAPVLRVPHGAKRLLQADFE